MTVDRRCRQAVGAAAETMIGSVCAAGGNILVRQVVVTVALGAALIAMMAWLFIA